MNSINKIWSDTLVYKPYINLKERKLSDNKQMYEEDDNHFSISLKNFLENTPVTVYKNCISYISQLDNIITGLKNFESFNDEDIQQAYNVIVKDKEYLSTFINKYINLYYKCDKEDLELEEDKMITILKTLDTTNKKKINYMNIYYDSYIGSMINAYCESIYNQDNYLYSEVTILNDYDNIKNNNIKNFIKKDYEKYTKNLSYNLDRYNENLDNDIVFKSLFKACKYKSDIKQLIDGFNEIDKTGNKFFVDKVFNVKENSINNLDNYCNDVFKLITLNNLYKNDYIENLSYIHSCKNLYKSL